MMGNSSGSKDLTALETVINVITNPDLVLKNAKTLKDLIAQNDASKSVALASKQEAEERHKQVSAKEAALAPRMDQLNAHQIDLNAREAALEKYKTELHNHADELVAREMAYKNNVAALDEEKRKHIALVASEQEKSNVQLSALGDRETAISDKEKELKTREQVLAKEEAELNERLENMAALATRKSK